MTDQASWLGKMPRADLPPLTRQWAIAAMQPRRHQDGSDTYVLTPPRQHTSGPWLRVLGIVAFILLALVSASWPMWKGN